MCKPVRSIVRFGVITLIAGGTLAVVAEKARPGSLGAIKGQVQTWVGNTIDSHIDDPIALRAQIRELEAQYPKKIAEVRSDLTEAEEQVAELSRELAVSERVVALTNSDLNQLDSSIEQARMTLADRPGVIVRIAFEDEKVSLDGALNRRTQVEQTRKVYQNRASEISTELVLLEEQKGQLADLLERLEAEQADFQAQLFQLDAQIDSIARGERMLDMMESRQATIDEHTKYQARSLDHLNGKLNKIRAEQRARMESLATAKNTQSYEDMARYQVDREGYETEVIVAPKIETQGVIEINPEEIEIDTCDKDSVASR